MPVLVDCDRLFVLSGISIPLTLLTNRRYICREYLEKILQNLKPEDSNLTLSS